MHGDTPEEQQQRAPLSPERLGLQQQDVQQHEQQQQIGQPQGQQPAAAALAPGGSMDRVYRLASVGQDCLLALWDIVVTEESVAAAQQASRPRQPAAQQAEKQQRPTPQQRTAPRSQGVGASFSTRKASRVPMKGCRHWKAATCRDQEGVAALSSTPRPSKPAMEQGANEEGCRHGKAAACGT